MRAIVLANGEVSRIDRLKDALSDADLIVCADGGANHAFAVNLIPDAIVGDFDSIAADVLVYYQSRAVDCIKHLPDKDQTDLELAVRYAIGKGAKELILVGGLGGRIDHLLGNITFLARGEFSQLSVRIVDCSDQGGVLDVLHGPRGFELQGKDGDIFSLIPIGGQVSSVNLVGAKWELTDATLEFGTSWSLSNVLIKPPAKLSIGEGCLLVYRG